MKVLICGHKSFAANGIVGLLKSAGHEVDCFSRGEEKSTGSEIFGNVFDMHNNPYLKSDYDILLNYIIIKDNTIEENLRYIKSLNSFCNKSVKHLLHVSSISVYPDKDYIDEFSEIEQHLYKKGMYGALKIAVDQYLLSQAKNYKLTFIRPGYIVENGKSFSKAGICIDLAMGVSLLLGNKKTSLPLIEKSRVNEAILKIVDSEIILPCYHLLENRKGTKYEYAKSLNTNIVLTIPSWLILPIVFLLMKFRIVHKTKFYQVKGLFKSTIFDSFKTEESLKLSMTKDSICIVGSGVYGSYTANAIIEKFPNAKITLLEIGNKKINSESEQGLKSNIIKGKYTGLSHGRYFGWGGTSNKWGGQLLLFTENDFKNPNQFLRDLIEISKIYKNKIFKRFDIQKSFDDEVISLKPTLFVRTGLWLGYFNRNLFKYFNIHKKSNIKCNGESRVISLQHEKNIVVGIRLAFGNTTKNEFYDQIILSAGAFESNRILLESKLLNLDKISFSDHLSQKVFKIKGSTNIGNINLQFNVSKSSLITKRIIGEIGDISYFANPIYNSEFPFFANVKRILFKGNFDSSIIKNTLKDIPQVLRFFYSLVVKRQIYVYKDEWYIYIDIENLVGTSNIKLSEFKDDYNVAAIDVDFDVNNSEIKNIYNEAIIQIENLLIANNVIYEKLSENFSVDKVEDTYHPYGMALSDVDNLKDYYNRYKGLLVLNTGVLPRAGGINTTAALFPIIEYYVDEILFK